MPTNFSGITFTEAVRSAQQQYYGRGQPRPVRDGVDQLGPDEIDFIHTRDSFYLATVSEDGWPYIQHRGGKAGFLRVTGPNSLAFADYKGNRQLLSTGNIAGSGRVAMFLMDYPQRTRLKLLGHARVEDARTRVDLLEQIAEPDVRRSVERLFLIDVVAFDWNCPKYITPRYTVAEFEDYRQPVHGREHR